MTGSDHEPRIAIYGTGTFGCWIGRLAVEKGWSVTAAYNRAGEKVGQDFGRLAGLDRDLGVVVEDCDLANYEELDADIGVVTVTNYLSDNFPAYERFIRAGVNVVCHGCESYYPYGCDPELARRIDEMARASGVTFTGTGIWDMSRIWAGILAIGPCTALRSIRLVSITDMKGQATAEQAAGWGVGLTEEAFYERGYGENKLFRAYRTVPEHVLAASGYTITGTSVTVEPVMFDEPLDSTDYMGRVIPVGESVGQRVVGEVQTKEGVTGRIETEGRLFRPGEVEHMQWHIDGLPTTRLRTEREDSGHCTAASVLNRIPQIIRAEPGIVLVSQLGPLRHTALA